MSKSIVAEDIRIETFLKKVAALFKKNGVSVRFQIDHPEGHYSAEWCTADGKVVSKSAGDDLNRVEENLIKRTRAKLKK